MKESKPIRVNFSIRTLSSTKLRRKASWEIGNGGELERVRQREDQSLQLRIKTKNFNVG